MTLRDVFYLEEHPFDPSLDPVTKFDFRARQAALSRGLDLFKFVELTRFYSQIGTFGTAAARATAQIAACKYPGSGGYPPVVLITGNRGQGSSSLATFVAKVVRDAAPNPAPALYRQPVGSDHFGKALFLIAAKLLSHLRKAGSPVADELNEGLSRVKAEDPDEATLLPFLEGLSTDAGVVPPLLLVLEKVTYSRADWPAKLHRAMKAFNVMFICITDDPRVPDLFNRDVTRGRVDGFELALDGLTREESLEFLRERLGLFRINAAPPEKTGLYPFLEAEVHKAFVGTDRLTISFLIRLLAGTFEEKLSSLAIAAAASPSRAAVTMSPLPGVADAYRSAINKVAATPVRDGGADGTAH